MLFCVRVVSNQPSNANSSPAQVLNEVATRLTFRETAEFLQAVVFVLCETLCNYDNYIVEVNPVEKKHSQLQGCDGKEEIMRK